MGRSLLPGIPANPLGRLPDGGLSFLFLRTRHMNPLTPSPSPSFSANSQLKFILS
ncbi:hypothetical protein KNP414_02602 [Paenibacillus mucilaginosus KNP414]|uniref:Uncharacterized protein n=1 Tax=Paenibacillus mucilaginosus (strain KNP414) TaxID=1036673 RepID=F8F5J0_PAEMK|nr:hypothetical protein KNP414_02602 [Paenibacillus mucilaginosus KNP414]